MASAARASNGGTAKARSCSRSVMTPPRPTITTGPNSGSAASPTIASTPGGAIGWITAPPIWAPSRACIVSYAARTASESASPSATPPTSDLCTTSPDRALRTTGNPTASAAAAACAAVAEPRVASTGTPQAASRRAA